MKLQLNNIGKIGKADIELNGITVIAGENNTGKSTVGRALFAVFNSFYNVQKQIEFEKVEYISRKLSSGVLRPSLYSNYGSKADEIAKALVRNYVPQSIETFESYLMDLLQQSVKADSDISIETSAIKDIKDTLEISNNDLLQIIIEKRLREEFYGQVSNIFNDGDGKINLNIQKDDISVQIDPDGNVKYSGDISLNTEVVYIDDPFVIDSVDVSSLIINYNSEDHRSHLCRKLFSDGNRRIVDELIAKEQFKKVFEKLDTVCSGDIIKDKSLNQFGYKRKDSDKVLNAKNLSTGLKSFAIIKKLILNGTIEKNGTIILDEPEIHLHPEWQLLFAEIIVLLHKTFDIHILLNTHSPYFLRAIQVYAAKYKIGNRCKYYLSDMNGDIAIIKDVSENIDEIYAKLASPFQTLENEEWSDGYSN